MVILASWHVTFKCVNIDVIDIAMSVMVCTTHSRLFFAV